MLFISSVRVRIGFSVWLHVSGYAVVGLFILPSVVIATLPKYVGSTQ